MSAPENGLHDTLMLARYSTETVYSLTPNDLPNGGSSVVPLPINATGAMQVPDGYGRNLSQIIDIGDLNLDGYGDLLIGYDTGDPANGERTDAGIVWLVSGKAVLDARDRGETFDPRRVLSN